MQGGSDGKIMLRPKRRKVQSCKKNEAVMNRLVTYNL